MSVLLQEPQARPRSPILDQVDALLAEPETPAAAPRSSILDQVDALLAEPEPTPQTTAPAPSSILADVDALLAEPSTGTFRPPPAIANGVTNPASVSITDRPAPMQANGVTDPASVKITDAPVDTAFGRAIPPVVSRWRGQDPLIGPRASRMIHEPLIPESFVKSGVDVTQAWERENELTRSPAAAAARGFVTGSVEGGRRVIRSLSSPVQLALTAAGVTQAAVLRRIATITSEIPLIQEAIGQAQQIGGATGAANIPPLTAELTAATNRLLGLENVRATIEAGRTLTGVTFSVEGAKQLVEAPTWAERGSAVAQIAGGAALAIGGARGATNPSALTEGLADRGRAAAATRAQPTPPNVSRPGLPGVPDLNIRPPAPGTPPPDLPIRQPAAGAAPDIDTQIGLRQPGPAPGAEANVIRPPAPPIAPALLDQVDRLLAEGAPSNAVQEPSTAAVDVRQPPDNGEAMGGRDTGLQPAAGTGPGAPPAGPQQPAAPGAAPTAQVVGPGEIAVTIGGPPAQPATQTPAAFKVGDRIEWNPSPDTTRTGTVTEVLPNGEYRAQADGMTGTFAVRYIRPTSKPRPLEPPTADVLDTGEQQDRLPEAGAVRDTNVPTPAIADVPFSLEAEPATRTAVEPGLFDSTATQQPAEPPAPEPDALPTLDDVKGIYRNIQQPPHPYYDVRNEKGDSPFPPGKPPAFYDPFVQHFDERAQTATAQANRMRNKPLNGSLAAGKKEAERWDRLAAAWKEAARVALMRKQTQLAKGPLEPATLTEEPHAPDPRGVPEGRLPEAPSGEPLPESPGRQPRPSPAQRRAAEEQAAFEDSLADARKSGYTGTDEELRTHFNEIVKSARELQDDLAQIHEEHGPPAILKAIAKAGGIGDDPMYPGEIAHLWEDSTGLIPGKGTTESGRVRRSRTLGQGGYVGVPGVLRKGGKTLDAIAESLRQDTRFAHILGPNELLDAIDDAINSPARGPEFAEVLGIAGVRKGHKWWEPAADAEDFEAPLERPAPRKGKPEGQQEPKIYHLPTGWYWTRQFGPAPMDFHGPFGPFATEAAARVDAHKPGKPRAEDDLAMPDRRKRADATGALVRTPGQRIGRFFGRGRQEKQLRPSEIVAALTKAFDQLPIRIGKIKQRALGIYKIKEQTIRLKVANDLDTLAHELGHHIHETVMGDVTGFPKYRQKVWKPIKDELLALGAATSRPSYTLRVRLQEGQAEFTRYYLHDPATAQQRAPVYYAAFEKGLEAHPELAAILARTQRQYIGYLAQDPVTRGLSHLDFSGVDPSPKVDLITRLQTAFIDDLTPLRVMVEDLADHRPIDVTRNGYALARLARGASAKADGFLRFGVRATDGRFVAGSLEAALKPIEGQMHEFAAYLVASRVPELRQRGMETGMTAAEAAAIRTKFDSPEFKTARKAVYDYQDSLLAYTVAAGMLSPDQYVAIKKLNRFYVPFQRVLDDVGAAAGSGRGPAGIANKPNPTKRIKGSGRDIINPLESIVKNTHTLVSLAEQNRAMLALVDQAVGTTGGGRYLERIPDKDIAIMFNLSQLEGEIKAVLDDAGVDYPQIPPLDFDKMVKVFVPTQFRVGERGIVSVLRNGEREWYSVNDQALYDALATMVPNQASNLVQVALQGPARVLRAGATTTLGFIGRNPIRDTWEAQVNSRYGFRLGYDTLRGLFLFLKKGEAYQQFLNSGAGNAALVGMDRNRLRQELVKLGAAERRRFADSLVLNPLNLLQALSEALENATRLGEFTRGVMKEGATAEGYARAALAARDVTIDFARGGSVSKEVNRYTAFFNAGVQGAARVAEVFRRDPLGATWRATAAITVPTIALWVINRDDPDYDELPQWERDTYWHIPTGRGHGHTWFRLPKPFQLGNIFANVPQAALNFLHTKDPAALTAALPDKDTAWKQIISTLPTAIMPAVETWTNYDIFRDRAIVNPMDLHLDVNLQYNRWTSELSKYVGPKLGLAPAKLDHLIYGYGAGLARGAVQTVDTGLDAIGVTARRKPAGGLPQWPLVGTFYRDTAGMDATSLEEFYRLRDRLQGSVDSVRRLVKSGDAPAAKARAAAAEKDYPNATALHERIGLADARLKELSDGVNQVFANPLLSPAEKKELLDRLVEQMITAARAGIGKPILPSRFSKAPAADLIDKLNRRVKPPPPVDDKRAPGAVESPANAPPARPTAVPPAAAPPAR